MQKEFFERARSRKIAIFSLVFGMVSGGIIGLLTPYFQSLVGTTGWGAYFPGVLFVTSIFLFYLAVTFSTRSENMPVVYDLIIAPENVVAICTSLESDIAKDEREEIRKFSERVGRLRRFFEDREALRVTGIDTLKTESRKVYDGFDFPLNAVQTDSLAEIGEYIDCLEQMQSKVVTRLHETCSICSNNAYKATKHEKGFSLKRKKLSFFRNPLLDISVETNAKHSILYPAFCIVTYFSQNFQDHLSAMQTSSDVLNRLRRDKQLMQLGVRIIPSDELEFWERMHHELNMHLERRQKEVFNELQGLEESIQKQIDALASKKKRKKENAGSA